MHLIENEKKREILFSKKFKETYADNLVVKETLMVHRAHLPNPRRNTVVPSTIKGF